MLKLTVLLQTTSHYCNVSQLRRVTELGNARAAWTHVSWRRSMNASLCMVRHYTAAKERDRIDVYYWHLRHVRS